MSENLAMWSYWRDDKGLVTALKDYFPETLKKHSALRQALMQIETARAYIDKEMTALQREAENAE